MSITNVSKSRLRINRLDRLYGRQIYINGLQHIHTLVMSTIPSTIGKTEQGINKRRLKENGLYQDIIFSSVLPFDYELKGSEIAVATTTNNNTVKYYQVS